MTFLHIWNVTYDFTMLNSVYALDRRGLTHILGARCTGGIVLIGDRRVIRGSGGYEYEDKIFADVRNVVIGASGIVGLFNKFRREIAGMEL